MKRCLVALGIAGALVLGAQPGAAQEGGKAAAVSAFDQAFKLLESGQVAEACLKLGESQRLDPQLGTLLHLADCLERNGQTATAWAGFRDAAELAASRGDQRQALAEERAAALQPRLSKLLIEVTPGNDLELLHVERDNVVVGKALWGAPIPTDPGPHDITVTAPGRRPWKGSVVIKADGSTVSIRVPVLETEVPTSPEASADKASQSPNVAAPRNPGIFEQHWPAVVAGAVGVVGLAVGTGFGIKSMSKGDEADQYCEGKLCTDSRGLELKKDAIAAGNVSTVAFAMGGVALAAGGVLWFALPMGSPREQQASVVVGLAHVGIRGTF